MAFTTETLPDEPIIITTLQGYMSAFEIIQARWAARDAMVALDSPYVYYIMDVREATSSFAEIVQHLKAYAADRDQATLPKAMKMSMMIVGTDRLAELSAQLLRNVEYGGRVVPLSPSMEHALEVARHWVAKNARSSVISYPSEVDS